MRRRSARGLRAAVVQCVLLSACSQSTENDVRRTGENAPGADAASDHHSPEPPHLDAGFHAPVPLPEPGDAGGGHCGDAGPPLSTLDYGRSPEVECLSPFDFVDRHGRYHGTEVGFERVSAGACPLPTELQWATNVGESCWLIPLCESVEQRTLPTSADEFVCCYLVNEVCGV